MKEATEWYLNNMGWIENTISGDYVKYYVKMYAKLTDENSSVTDEVAVTKEDKKMGNLISASPRRDLSYYIYFSLLFVP